LCLNLSADELKNMESTDNKKEEAGQEFEKLIAEQEMNIPKIGEIVKGIVISAGKSEVKLDIDGVMVGIVRGRELYRESAEYANLKEGDEVEATVIDLENENSELELSFSYAGHQKAWATLVSAFESQEIIKVKIKEANKGGLIIIYGQIAGFLPVSQLSPENYPRISGGDKGKILEKLRSFINKEFEVKIMDLSEREDKLIVSEKLAWSERQKDIISQYQPGTVVEGSITAVTNFGAFISFGEGLEGLIHISELAWQRIDNPSNIVKVGDKIKAEIINVDGAKIFLSAKKLMKDPWENVKEKYTINDKVTGKVLKVNPFGLFVGLDNDIHALAHISSLGLNQGEDVKEKFIAGEDYEFYIISLEPKEHRLGLSVKPIKTSDKEQGTKDDEIQVTSDKEQKSNDDEKAETKETNDETTETVDEDKKTMKQENNDGDGEKEKVENKIEEKPETTDKTKETAETVDEDDKAREDKKEVDKVEEVEKEEEDVEEKK